MDLSAMNKYRDVALLLLRLTIAATFIMHGTMKWDGWADPATMSLTMKILSVAEPLGGAALLVGILSRWAALGLAIIMCGAIWTKMGGAGVLEGFAARGGWEFDAALLGGCLVILTHGAGKMALDAVMLKR